MKRSLLLASTLALAGCAELATLGIGHREDDIQGAIDRKDYAELDRICSNVTYETNTTRPKACEALRDHDVELVVAAPCDQKNALLDRQGKKHGTSKGNTEVAKSIFACNMGEALVAEHGGWTSAQGDFASWEAAGLPITKTAIGILSSPGVTQLGKRDIAGLVKYVVKRGAFGSCDAIYANVRSAPLTVRDQVGPYFVAAKCTNAVPLFEGMLTEDDPRLRGGACWSLGEIGGRSSITKLSLLADSDAAYEIVDLNKVYYVRDACRAAAGKIRLRNVGGGGRVSAR